MTKYWIKLYHEMLNDWKVLSLPDSLKWRFIQCLLVAGDLNQGGWLPEIRQFAAQIRPMNPADLQADLSRLALAELVEIKVDDDGKERWFIPKFEQRQTRSANAKRQAAWRQREKEKKEEKKRKEEETEKIRLDIDTSNVTSNVTSNAYDAHAENATPQNVLDALTAIANVCKGKLNALTPSDDFERLAYQLADDVAAIPGFSAWWKANGYYPGKPAFKSFRDEWDNYIEGIDMTAANGSDSDGFKTQAPGYHISGSI